MLKQVASAFWKIVRLAQETDRNRQSIKELEKLYSEIVAAMEKKFYESQLANERLVHEVQRLTDELKHQREIAESERRVLKVELENYLLRQEHGQPPVEQKQLPKTSKDEAIWERQKSESCLFLL